MSSGLSGPLVSALAHLRNTERRHGASAPQAESPAPVPATGGNAVRFDFSDPQAQAAASAVSAGPAARHAAPASPAAAPTPVSPAARDQATTPSAAVTRASAAGKANAAADPKEAAAGPRIEQAAEADDEAAARAWAIRSLARESTLGLIDRIARMTDEPAQTGAAPDDVRPDQKTPEPRTLAIA